METIIIKLDSRKMDNPDLDIRYLLPDLIEECTDNKVLDNGYDHLNDDELGIWLETEHAEEMVGAVIEIIRTKTVLDNDLTKSAEIYCSPQDCAELCDCKKVFPL